MIYEVFKMLDYGGEVCETMTDSNEAIAKDKCAIMQVEKKMKEEIGCSTPFSTIEVSQVTTVWIYEKYKDGQHFRSWESYPC